MADWTRRGFLTAAGAAALAAGCAPRAVAWRPDESALVGARRDDFDLVLRGSPDSRVLRRRARTVQEPGRLAAIAARMERTLEAAGGVGLAAPQVGLSVRAALVQLGWKGPEESRRLVFAVNPTIEERSDETIEFWEACLSIPEVGGRVRRSQWVRVAYTTLDGRQRVVESDGADAVLWQHEIDHLDGTLYTDRLLGELLPIEEMRRRREAGEV